LHFDNKGKGQRGFRKEPLIFLGFFTSTDRLADCPADQMADQNQTPEALTDKSFGAFLLSVADRPAG